MLQAIGLMTAAAAQTEHILGQFIGGMLRIDDVDTEALTAHMAIPLKDQIIRTLAALKTRYVYEIDKVDDLLDAAHAAFSKRNTVVHNALCIDPNNGNILSLRAKARGSLQVSLQVVTVDEIKQDAAAIYKVGIDILEFMISRDLLPRHRTTPLTQTVNRGKKARAERAARLTG